MQNYGTPPPTPAIAGGPAAHPACAACSHQRKKCSDKCELAPHLPATRKAEFNFLQRVFGVSNLTKLLRIARLHANPAADGGVADENGRLAIESMIWEARKREEDPILGSYGAYERVRRELEESRRRIGQLLRQLELCGHVGGVQGGSNTVVHFGGGSDGPFIVNGNGVVPVNYVGESRDLMMDRNRVHHPYVQGRMNGCGPCGEWYDPISISRHRSQQ